MIPTNKLVEKCTRPAIRSNSPGDYDPKQEAMNILKEWREAKTDEERKEILTYTTYRGLDVLGHIVSVAADRLGIILNDSSR